MENYVFKKDYSIDGDCDEKKEATAEDLVPSAMIREYIKFHTEFMKRLPKIVVKKDKETFERVVPKLNKLAQILKGSIEATVDYEKWDSHIIMTFPFFEVTRDEEIVLPDDVETNDEGEPKLKKGSQMQLKVEFEPENTTYKDIEWSVSEEGIATIDENGVITANATGIVIVTAEAKSGVTETIEIEVYSNAGDTAAGIIGLAAIGGGGAAWYYKKKKKKETEE